MLRTAVAALSPKGLKLSRPQVEALIVLFVAFAVADLTNTDSSSLRGAILVIGISVVAAVLRLAVVGIDSCRSQAVADRNASAGYRWRLHTVREWSNCSMVAKVRNQLVIGLSGQCAPRLVQDRRCASPGGGGWLPSHPRQGSPPPCRSVDGPAERRPAGRADVAADRGAHRLASEVDTLSMRILVAAVFVACVAVSGCGAERKPDGVSTTLQVLPLLGLPGPAAPAFQLRNLNLQRLDRVTQDPDLVEFRHGPSLSYGARG